MALELLARKHGAARTWRSRTRTPCGGAGPNRPAVAQAPANGPIRGNPDAGRPGRPPPYSSRPQSQGHQHKETCCQRTIRAWARQPVIPGLEPGNSENTRTAPRGGSRLIPLRKILGRPRTCHCQGPAVLAPHGISHRPATRISQALVTRRRGCTPRDWHELRRSRPLAHATRAAPDQTTSQETRIRPNEPDPVQATPTPGLLAGACCAAHGPRPWDPLERCPTQPRYGGSGQY